MTGVRLIAALCVAASLGAPAHAGDALRVCADPDNSPFTTKADDGFDNRIARLLADQMGRQLTYHWRELGVGFLRQTLQAGVCDVVMGYAADDWRVLSTSPYYRSSFLLVTLKDSDIDQVTALDDPRLTGRRIGVVAGGPPAAHLARLGLIGDARPYPLTVDRRFNSPAAQMLKDLTEGEIEAAAVWGPLAGADIAADERLVAVPLDAGDLPPSLTYEMTIAVRLGDEPLKAELEAALAALKPEIDAILDAAHVPLAPPVDKIR